MKHHAPTSLAPDTADPESVNPGPLQAAHTPNFPALLRQLDASLLVTTYQAGKLVIVRDEGDHLNTHFRAFQAPMGLAWPTKHETRTRHHHAGPGVPRRPRRSPPPGTGRPGVRRHPRRVGGDVGADGHRRDL